MLELNPDKLQVFDCYNALMLLFKNEGNWAEYLKYIKLFYNLKEDILNIDIQVQLNKFQIESKISDIKTETVLLNQRVVMLEQLLDSRQMELINFVALISDKTEFVNLIENELEKFSKSNNDESGALAKKIMGDVRSGKPKEIRDNFHLNFLESNQDYALLIIKKFPKITSMELKVSALLRMNVSYKDAARMLNISPRTIESHVYSLRKKFNLKKQENLSHFLSTIEN